MPNSGGADAAPRSWGHEIRQYEASKRSLHFKPEEFTPTVRIPLPEVRIYLMYISAIILYGCIGVCMFRDINIKSVMMLTFIYSRSTLKNVCHLPNYILHSKFMYIY